MASVHLGQNGVEKLLPPDADHDHFGEVEVSPQNPSDKFGDPEIIPRIGDEYQVELPPLIGKSNYMSDSRNCIDAETGADPHKNFLVGLPLLLTWISSIKRETSSRNTHSKNVIKTEASFGEDEPVKELQNLPTAEKTNESSGPGYLLAPGLSDVYWSALEKESFLLGLYIFEKNFVEVRRFVGTKDMGALLSFYYAEFYCSQEYRRWTECRKMKSKKGIYGQRIFTGLRQQELLSRIIPRVSEECRSALLQVSKAFGDEKMSLTDYVSSLKSMIGMNILVEAVGIGTGKQDLTVMAVEPSKSTQARREIPTGKSCSSLTTSEIIKYLSGDYRLSKARSNDLFWEAVWPRLLARGWHSEQPKNQGYVAGSKHCLVFLMPGVKKFSRRKLVKGDHYFDSVADVLSKVAQDPELIELESEEENDDSRKKEECEWTSEQKSEQDDDDRLKREQQHCYLQPRTPKRNAVVLKFTVVDTSLSNGEVRELRSLPSEISSVFIVQDQDKDSDEDMGIDESDNKVKRAKSDQKRKPLCVGKNSNASESNQESFTVYPYISAALVPDLKNKKDLQGKDHSRKVSETLLSRKVKRRNADDEAPPTKRSCSQEEETNANLPSSWAVPRLENGMSSCSSDIHEVTKNSSSRLGLCLDKLSSTSSSKGSAGESSENPRTVELIDLNLPQVCPDLEDGFVCSTEPSKVQDSASVKMDDPSATEARSEQQLNLNPRRHSARNPTPTARSLEALANGYLTVSRRRKGKETNSHEDLMPRPSHHARGVVRPNESANSSAASQNEEAENGVSSSDNKFHHRQIKNQFQANEQNSYEQTNGVDSRAAFANHDQDRNHI